VARGAYNTIKPYYNKYKMLRGTRAKQSASVWGKRQTLQNQITALKSQVSQNKPEVQHFFSRGEIISDNSADKISHFSLSNAVKDDPEFRLHVTGDKWQNIGLYLRTYFTSDNTAARILIYVPKVPGDRFSPNSNRFVTLPDPRNYWILRDITVDRTDRSGQSGSQVVNTYADFKKLITEYNQGNDDIMKGEIVVTFMTNGSSGSPSPQMEYGMKLTYHNK